jgi:uncharacterized protein (TIGR02099 family)
MERGMPAADAPGGSRARSVCGLSWCVLAVPHHPSRSAELSSAPLIAEAVPESAPEAGRTLLVVRLLKLVAAVLISAYFVAALGVLGLRYLVLPRIDEYRPQLAALLSRSLGQQVTVGHVAASWQGVHARVAVEEVRLHDRQGRLALSLPRIEGAIGWRSLLAGEVRFTWLAIDGADLMVRRDGPAHVSVAGILLDDRHDFAHWLLRQREVAVRGSRVEWRDDVRGAPPLALEAVEIHLVNRGALHRFALRGLPPAELASAIDIRGELRGRSLGDLREWKGRLFAEVDRVDLAAWRAWFDYPLKIEKGAGGVRVWVGLDDLHLTEAVADVALSGVAARLADDLPMLELDTLQGRLGARGAKPGTGFLSFVRGRQPGKEIFGRDLAFGLRGEPYLAPSDFTLRWEPRGEGDDGNGEVRAASLELAPLAALAERLPLPDAVRRLLQAAAPTGQLGDLVYKWQGPLDAPTRYGARGQFQRLGAKPHGHAPGFTGLAGSFELDQASGSVRIDAKQATLAWPSLLVDATPARPFVLDSVAGRASWSRRGDRLDVSWEDFAFSGPEAAGLLRGRWTTPGSPGGGLELAVDGARADARSAYRFVPHLHGHAEEWMRAALKAGQVSDLKLRLKGDPHDFPFDDPARGQFELSMKLAQGTLQFAPDWPAIEGITASLRFERRRMDIEATSARTLGIPLAPVRASMERLIGEPHVLVVDGGAEAPAGEMLRYVAASPVATMTGQGLAGITVDGRAKLALRLELPLADLHGAKVAGTVTLAGSNVVLKADEPPLSQVAGSIAFSEQGVTTRGLSAQVLGGPATITFGTREDRSITFTAQGSVSAGELARRFELPLAARIQGTAMYRAAGAVRNKVADYVVESNLQGVSIDLPPPFGKGAGDIWPSRLERTAPVVADPRDRSQRRDSVTANVGSVMNLKAVVRQDGAGAQTIERLGLAIGEVQAALPKDPGIAVTGRLPALDVDPLVALGREGGGGVGSDLRTIELKVDDLAVAGRRLHDVALGVRLDNGGWQARIDSREVAGTASYRSEGQGAVLARLARLAIPAASAEAPGLRRTLEELPALDIVAEDFLLGGRSLGRLELVAVNGRDEWRIDRLDVLAPEGEARLRGTWRPAGATPQRTDVSFTIESPDVGAYLDRIGLPHTVARGAANLSGKVSWNGPVYAIDFASLFGNARLEAQRGQFLRVKPGIGKLLGVLSLQALPRRITLDFRDVFSEGFAFDTITASADIARGVLSTTDFTMVGPAASVTMRGVASLGDETQDLRVRVVPQVGDSVAAAAGLALVNPVVGLGALVAQRVLKDPIGQMLAYEYHVTGAWDDPKVERLDRVSGMPPVLSAAEPPR